MNPRIENARERLMGSAKEIALARRNHEFTISEVTASCGIGIGTFYHYFKGKDDLVAQILEQDWDIVLGNIDRNVSPDKSHYENAKYIFDQIYAFERTYRLSPEIAVKRSARIARVERECREKMNTKIAGLIEKEVRRGNFSFGIDSDRVAIIITRLCIDVSLEPNLTFDDLWKFLYFQDSSSEGGLGNGQL